MIISEGSKFITELIRLRVRKPPAPTSEQRLLEMLEAEPEQLKEAPPTDGKESAIATGCVPCAVGHYGTCSGLLNEGMRFARDDGIDSGEVIDRINMCLDELNSMERVDLRPELIANLPPWEKELAEKALSESRSLRHSLEGISSTDQLEKVAAATQTTRQEIGRKWFKERLSRMSPQEKKKLAEKAMEKMGEEG